MTPAACVALQLQLEQQQDHSETLGLRLLRRIQRALRASNLRPGPVSLARGTEYSPTEGCRSITTQPSDVGANPTLATETDPWIQDHPHRQSVLGPASMRFVQAADSSRNLEGLSK